MVKVEINFDDENWKILIPDCKKIINQAVKKAFQETLGSKKLDTEVSILLTTNKEIKKLNYNHRNKNKATNVLAFPMNNINNNKNIILGDIAIALETIVIEARAYKISKKKYLSKMVIHGVLHLIGYDHINNEDFKKMNTIEKIIFKKIYA